MNLLTARHGLKTWSAVYLGQHWKIATYVSNLPGERWVVRALNWFPENARRVGRPAYTCDSMTQQFCRRNQMGNWQQRAHTHDIFYWMNQLDEFIFFHWKLMNVKCIYGLLCLPAPFWHAGFTHFQLRYHQHCHGYHHSHNHHQHHHYR